MSTPKIIFYHKGHKGTTKRTKIKFIYSANCVLCEKFCKPCG